MKEKYMIVQVYDGDNYCFNIIRKNYTTPESALEDKENIKKDTWYIVMPYYE